MVLDGTKVVALELALNGQASVLFRTRPKAILQGYDYMEGFLTNFAKCGEKWKPIDLLLSLKHEVMKIVHDYIPYTTNLHHQMITNYNDRLFDDKLICGSSRPKPT